MFSLSLSCEHWIKHEHPEYLQNNYIVFVQNAICAANIFMQRVSNRLSFSKNFHMVILNWGEKSK